MESAKKRVCLDVGGTFTDCLVMDASGDLTSFKSATTPNDPSDGLLDTLKKAAANFQLGTATGKFHGVIQPTTPMGCLIVMQNLFDNSEGVVTPNNLLPSPDIYSRKSIAS